MKVELCCAPGTEDETLICGTVQCCGESERELDWTRWWRIACINCQMKLGFACFRVRTVSGNHTAGPVTYKSSSKGTDSLTASFSVSSSVQLASVWVQAQNPLGSAVSTISNYTLSDIGKTAAMTVWWVCEVLGNVCMEISICFMCSNMWFVRHEITVNSYALKVLRFCSNLEVNDKWWLTDGQHCCSGIVSL